MATISNEINCCHVEPAIEAKANEEFWFRGRQRHPGPFLLAYQLVQWGLKCLNEKINEEDSFPEDQEKILFDAIRENTGKLKPELIKYETVALKRFRAILQDYRAGDDAAYNGVLMAGLQAIYAGIFQKPKKGNLSIQKEKWEIQIDQVRIALVPNEPKFNNNMEDFLQLQVDVSSLMIIKSQIQEFLTTKDNLSANDYVLALQRVFQITGEFLKKSQMSPNLSDKTRQSLKEKNIPVELLNEYRDLLTHLQSVDPNDIFRSSEFEKYKKPLEEAWLGFDIILKNEIRDLEEDFLQRVVKEKIGVSEEQKQLLESCKTNVIACLEKEIRTKNAADNICSKEIEREIVQYAKHMKSVEYPDVGTEIVPDTSAIGDTLIYVIVESKHGQYDSLRSELKTTHLPLEVVRLMTDHDYQIGLMTVEYILKYGTLSAKMELFNVVNLMKIYIPDLPEDFNNMEKWALDRKPWLSKEDRLAEAKELLQGRADADELMNMLIRLGRRKDDFHPKLYEDAVKNLKSLSESEKAPLTYISVEWAVEKYFQDHKTDLIPFYNKLLGSETIIKPKARDEALKRLAGEVRQVTEDLHFKRLKQAIEGLIPLTDPSAVQSEVLNILTVRTLILGKPGRDNSNESRGGFNSNESGDKSEPEINDDEYKQFRDFLAHSDDLASRDQKAEIATSLVVMKDEIKEKLIGLKDERIDLEEVGDIMNTLYQPAMGIKEILCPGSTNVSGERKRKWEGEYGGGKGRTTRETESCLTADDVEKVVDDDDGLEIDSRKILDVLSQESFDNEGKFDNFIALASQSELTGSYKEDAKFVVGRQETSNKHWETVEAFSGKAIHGLMVKNIIGELLRGDIKGVSVDMGFLGGGYGMEVIAKRMAAKGAYLVDEGSIMLGRSMEMAAPFLSKGMTVFVAYDLYDQVKALKSCQTKECKADAIVGIVGDSVQVGVDTAEVVGPTIVNAVTGTLQLAVDAAGLDIEIAGSLVLESAAAVLGPLGIALNAAVFIGTDIYKAVREVEEIDKQLHLTGWEKFGTGVKAFLGLDADLENEIENKQWNTNAVEQATATLKNDPNIKRYIFPSYVQVVNCTQMAKTDDVYDYGAIITLPICCTEIMSAIHSTVRLTQKVDDIKWSWSSPDDVPDADVFCKPVADPEKDSGQQAPGSYYCQNAIGVEYNEGRTDDYALINMGIGNSYVEGFPDSGNIFIINRRNKTLIGGNKDDNFIFHRDPTANRVTKMKTYCDSYALQKLEPMDVSQELFGGIDGKGGTNTVDVNGIKLTTDSGTAKVTVNFPKNTLMFQNDRNLFNIKNINQYLGVANGPDIVTANCGTTYIDGRKGYDDDNPDVITIPDLNCQYNTTIIVNPFTTVVNEADAGAFRYFVNGDVGKVTKISLNDGTKNTFQMAYNLDDLAAIDKSSDTTTFSFVDDYYDKSVSEGNTFNLTITGGHNSSYLLKDKTSIVVGNYNLYALKNTDRDIDDDAIEEYMDISKSLNMYLVVQSNNQVLTVAGRHNDVLTNDPKSEISHFISGAGKNVFSFISGQNKYTKDFRINDVVIHFYDTGSADRIDLRRIAAQVMEGLGKRMGLEMTNVQNDLILSLLHPDGVIMKITLKNVVDCADSRIQIVSDVAFSIEQTDGHFHLVPLPLIFDDPNVNLIVIHPRDVVEGMKIKIYRRLQSHTLARKDDSLIITNSTNPERFKSSITVVLHGFYTRGISDKMMSLIVEFEDKIVQFRQEELSQLREDSFQEMKEMAKRRSFYLYKKTAMMNRSLFEAIDNGKIVEARDILNRNIAYVDDKDKWGVPLMRAVDSQNTKAVKFMLLEGHANVTIVGTDGRSPLYYAVKYREQEMINWFMDRLFKSRNNEEAVMGTITSGLPIVKYVTERWKNIDERDWQMFMEYKKRTKATLLHYAMIYGNIDVVKYLITKGGEDGDITAQDRYGKMPLYYAVKYKHSSVIDYFNIVIRTRGVIPLSLSVAMGQLSTIMYLIEKKDADIYEKDMFGKTPLFYAVQHGSDDIIDYLIHTIKKDGDGQVWIYPVITGDMTVLEFLMNRERVPVNAGNFLGKTALHYAALTGNLQMVETLCDHGADVDVKDKSGRTPLDSAIRGQNATVVEYLCKRLNVDAFMAAAKAGKKRLLVQLTKGDKMKLQRTDDAGNSLLHLAVESQRADLVEYLVDNGMDPNARNNDGNSPLHCVVMCRKLNGQCLKLPNSLKIGKLLIDKGADVNAPDYSELTPLDKVVKYLDDSYLPLLKLLVEHGAHVAEGLHRAEVRDRNSAFSKYLRDKMKGQSERRRRQIDDEQQPDQKGTSSQTSTNVVTSAFTNGFLNWAQTSFNRLLNYQPNNNPDAPMSYGVDANSTLMLIDLLIRKATGQKYVGTSATESPLDIQARALNIVRIFEETLTELDINYQDDFDPVALQSVLIRQLRAGRSSEIPKTLLTFAKQASSKSDQSEIFLERVRNRLSQDLKETSEPQTD